MKKTALRIPIVDLPCGIPASKTLRRIDPESTEGRAIEQIALLELARKAASNKAATPLFAQHRKVESWDNHDGG